MRSITVADVRGLANNHHAQRLAWMLRDDVRAGDFVEALAETLNALVPHESDPEVVVTGAIDSERLEWLANSGRWMQRLGSNWRVAPGAPTAENPMPRINAPWFPSIREAIDAERQA